MPASAPNIMDPDRPDLRISSKSILELFQDLTEALQGSSNLDYHRDIPIRDLDNEFQRFRLWASNLGVFALGHASLEYRFRDASALKIWALDTLNELVDQLRQREF